MSTRQIPRNDYAELTARFAAVRRAWKRSAALAGLAVVATETLGIFTGLLFIDWLYQPPPLLRTGLWGLAVAFVIYLLARHVFKPLTRQIPDEQIALFLEEHRADLSGVLITAVEYGRKREGTAGNEGALIDAVVKEAAAKSGRGSVGRTGDFARLAKYGLIALVAAGLYVLLSVLLPATLGHHVGRVLEPWQATPEDVARHQAALEQAAPLRIKLSRGSTSLPRGSSFTFEATLSKSKPPDSTVKLFLRSRGSAAPWQQLPMTELEQLNGYQGIISDVSENLEFYVACGSVHSETCQLAAYDPLVVQKMEVTIHYPDYVKEPDQIIHPFTGDLTALVGSTAILRIVASTPLKEGQIKWASGLSQPMVLDPQVKAQASFSFEVKEDTTFDYRLVDVNGQQASSAAPLSIHALPDNPPTIKVISPESPVLTQPLGEIDFDAQADDDFGVAGVDLLYSREDGSENNAQVRVPLPLVASMDKQAPHAVTCSYRLALEDFNPPLQPGDAISYQVEARDGKGQKATSEIGFIIVGYYEQWATWAGAEPASLHHAGVDLMSLLNLTWQLDGKKASLATTDFQKQSQDIAAQLVGPDGTVADFLHLAKYPKLTRLAPVINRHIMKAHAALAASDTSAAIPELSTAVGLIAGGQLKENTIAHMDEQMLIGSTFNAPAATLLELTRAKTLAAAATKKTHEEGNAKQAEKAAALAKKVEELRQQQGVLVAQGAAAAAAEGKAPAPGKGSQAAATKGKADLAAAEHALAGKTRAAGTQAGIDPASNGSKIQAAAIKTNEAARLMEEAARAFASGNSDDANAKANLANIALRAAAETLSETDHDKLEAAISDAARHAAMLLEQQQDLSASTTATGTELGANKPDQRQQRDLQAQAYRQTVLGANTEALASEVQDLARLAAQVGQPESGRELEEAQKVLKRTPPQTKMSDAVIDLNNLNASEATGDQNAAETSLQKIVDHLQAASESLADSREAQLSRANRAAQETKESMAALLAKNSAPAGAAPSSSSTGVADAADAIRQAAYNLGQLSAVVDNRQIVAQDDSDRLRAMSADKAALEKQLATDPKFLSDASTLVDAVANKIEAELRAKAEEGKLYSSQREECPPEYRLFVNKYFEDLSHSAPSLPPESQASPAGQP